jgi:hypothetical protein
MEQAQPQCFDQLAKYTRPILPLAPPPSIPFRAGSGGFTHYHSDNFPPAQLPLGVTKSGKCNPTKLRVFMHFSMHFALISRHSTHPRKTRLTILVSEIYDDNKSQNHPRESSPKPSKKCVFAFVKKLDFNQILPR